MTCLGADDGVMRKTCFSVRVLAVLAYGLVLLGARLGATMLSLFVRVSWAVNCLMLHCLTGP